MSEPRCVVLEDRGLLRLAGKDAKTFLQGLISNDIALLSPGQALYAALLTPQGKYLFDFLLFERNGEILLDGELARLPALRQRLTMYRLRSKVDIEDVSESHAVLAVYGPGAAAALDLPEKPGAARASGEALMAVDPRLTELGARVVLPRAAVESFAASVRLTQGTPADYDRHRLVLGVPDGSRDLIVEKMILLEAGFEELHGVSFGKGCFVGQELTARTKYRGLVKRRLVPVRIEGPAPAPGTIIERGGREAGEMRSSCGSLGLAMLRLEQIGAGAETSGPLTAGGSMLIPQPPSWLQLGR